MGLYSDKFSTVSKLYKNSTYLLTWVISNKYDSKIYKNKTSEKVIFLEATVIIM